MADLKLALSCPETVEIARLPFAEVPVSCEADFDVEVSKRGQWPIAEPSAELRFSTKVDNIHLSRSKLNDSLAPST